MNKESPFRIEDDTTWDTNLELGIYWGLRLVERDEELHGKNPNAKVFVLMSDGQAWSGQAARLLQMSKQRGLPVFVIGVGTSAGGIIPEPPPKTPNAPVEPPLRSTLDRTSLAQIANAGGGQDDELDREGDREISNKIIDAARRRSGSRGLQVGTEELYWRCLAAAAVFLAVGILFMQERTELLLQAAGAGVALALVWSLTR